MAKTTRAGGPSYTPEEEKALEYIPRVRRAEVGPMKREQRGDKSSPGSNLNQSGITRSRSEETRDERDRLPAQETDNPSSLSKEASENVDSVGGNIQETATASRKPPRKAAKRTEAQKARVRSIDDDDDF